MITKQEFEAEARAFLVANAKPRPADDQGWGKGSDAVGLFAERAPEEDRRYLEESREWRALLFDHGFGWISGPAPYGGRELPVGYERHFEALEAGFDTPPPTTFAVSLGMVAPTILAHGTDAAKERYLRALYRGDLLACQLFSEPDAGSDLAGLRTTVVPEADGWVLNGQKVWTSGAHYSDIGEVICRTDPDAPKHLGLSAFLVDMRAPGVEVRPLRQMTGGASFNEVFLSDVRVEDDHRLGEVNQGWAVALTTLMNERASVGGILAGAGASEARLLELIRHFDTAGDPVVRQRMADVYIHASVLRYNVGRAMAKIRSGQAPGPEMSTAKLAFTQNLQRIGELVTSVLGPRLVADTGEWGTFAWSKLLCGIPGARLAGGTDEIQRNILAERVLGLPKDPTARSSSLHQSIWPHQSIWRKKSATARLNAPGC